MHDDPVKGPADAQDAATRLYLRGQPIEMKALAAGLGVGRATLYRWVGSRERLLGLVLADMTERTINVAMRGVGGSGPERILTVLERVMHRVVDAEPLRAFAGREPALFVRLVATPGPVEDRAIAMLRDLLQEETDRGTLQVPLATETLAHAIVRIADSFMYAHYLGGSEPAVDTALEVVELLLRPRVSADLHAS